jgi:hypothetical protein
MHGPAIRLCPLVALQNRCNLLTRRVATQWPERIPLALSSLCAIAHCAAPSARRVTPASRSVRTAIRSWLTPCGGLFGGGASKAWALRPVWGLIGLPAWQVSWWQRLTATQRCPRTACLPCSSCWSGRSMRVPKRTSTEHGQWARRPGWSAAPALQTRWRLSEISCLSPVGGTVSELVP